MRHRLAVFILLAGIGCAGAQTADEGPPVRLAQSTQAPIGQSQSSQSQAQSQAFTSCLMNCDTRAGSCQGTCSVSNSVQSSFPVASPNPFNPTFNARPDTGSLTQCYISCTTQQLVCKQGCGVH